MGVPKKQAQQNRQRILDTASRVFRERGVDGVCVADLMKLAGFTHGGFYNHFESKDALAAEACADAFACAVARIEQAAQDEAQSQDQGFARHLVEYLSRGHCDDPGEACPLSTLAVDAARQGKQLQAAYAAGFEMFLQAVSAHLSRRDPGAAPACIRKQAISLVTSLVGALILARGIGDASPALSDEVLDVCRLQLPLTCGPANDHNGP